MRRNPLDLDAVIQDIRARGLDQVIAKWGLVQTGSERRQKYLDLPYWMPSNIKRVQRLGLDTSGPQRILDLGCGCGYFLYLCKLLGHEVLGVDRRERDSLFVDMRKLLDVPSVDRTIRAGEPLAIDGSWDVVTAHMVTFNRHRQPNPWGPDEWAWLLSELPAPVWNIELNLEPSGVLYTPGLREMFTARGAEIREHRVTIIS